MANASSASSNVSGASSGSAGIPPPVGAQTSSDAAADIPARSPEQQTPTEVPPEPEFELSNGKKFKRSEFEKRIGGLEKGFTQASQKLAERTRKLESLEGALKRFGVSVEDFLTDPDAHFTRAAQEVIAKQVDDSLLDPKEREFNDRERKLAEREAKQKQFEEDQQANEQKARVEAEADNVARGMVPALTAAGLPANPKTVARVAEVMRAALVQRRMKLDPSEAAAYVAEQIQQEQEFARQGRMKSSPDALIAELGPEGVEIVRQHLLAQHKQKPLQPRTPAPVTRDAQTGQYIGWGDYAKMRRL